MDMDRYMEGCGSGVVDLAGKEEAYEHRWHGLEVLAFPLEQMLPSPRYPTTSHRPVPETFE